MSSRSKNVDRLTSLPEEVLSNILSKMPTKFAVRTSTLSKRWRYSWTLVTNLDFNDYHHVNDLTCFSKFVDRVLKLCKTSQLKSFRLGLFRLSVRKSDVSKWINEAIRLNVCELDIQARPIELPLSLFTCKTVKNLRLVVSFDDFDVFNVQSSVMLPNLKTLDLCVLSNSSVSKPSVNVLRFINGCPVLESLSLEIMSDNEEDYTFNIPTLERLELRTGCLYLNKVVMNVPNLEYLLIGGQLCPHFVMEDLSSLVEATVSFNGLRDCNQNKLLKVLSGVRSLSLFTSTLNDFVHSPLPKFPNLKRLELKGSFRSPWLLVFQHLESSSELEHFCFEEVIELFLSFDMSNSIVFPHVTFGYLSTFVIILKPDESRWIEPQSVPTCMLSNLKTMKITKCKGRECDIEFLKYMLRNAEVLKRLTIICAWLPMRDEMEMCEDLLKIPRASRFCEIHFVGRWHNYVGN